MRDEEKGTRGVHRYSERFAKEGRRVRTLEEYIGKNQIASFLLDCLLVWNMVGLSVERVIERDASQFANLSKSKHAPQTEELVRTVDLDPSAATT